MAKSKTCEFCSLGAIDIDYRQIELLKRYIGVWGKILPRSKTGVCAKHQRKLATAIKRARHLALLPFTTH